MNELPTSLENFKIVPTDEGIMNKPLTSLDNYRLLGNSGLRVSPMCLGTMTFGEDWGWGADFETSQQIFNTYADRGGNFIDTANMYTNGSSEEFLGKMLQGKRDEFVLATKYSSTMNPKNPNSGGNHRRSMVRAVEGSLKRLNTDYIDLYWLHVWDYRNSIEEVLRALDDLVRQGKILHIGFSDTPSWVVSEGQAIAKLAEGIARLRGWTPISAIQVHYNLVERTSETDLIPMAQHHDITPLAWSPLAGGVLAGKYSMSDLEEDKNGDGNGSGRKEMSQSMGQLNERSIKIGEKVKEIAQEIGRSPSQVSLNWLLQQPGGTIPIVGARKLSHVEDNLQAVDFTLTSEQIERLNEASDYKQPFPYNFATPQLIDSVIDGETEVEEALVNQ